MVQRIEHQNPPGEIFRSMAESAANLFDNDGGDDLVNELCCDEGLASVSNLSCDAFICATFKVKTSVYES